MQTSKAATAGWPLNRVSARLLQVITYHAAAATLVSALQHQPPKVSVNTQAMLMPG
jgi:hypothetical protein